MRSCLLGREGSGVLVRGWVARLGSCDNPDGNGSLPLVVLWRGLEGKGNVRLMCDPSDKPDREVGGTASTTIGQWDFDDGIFFFFGAGGDRIAGVVAHGR